MIVYKTGNLLDQTSGIIVHGCNMQGVMGSGVAKQIKARYPQAYEDYMTQLRNRDLGDVIFSAVSDTLVIANALTQEYYGLSDKQYVDYSAIEAALIEVMLFRNPCEDVHMPRIGAGLGGGSWDVIEIIINDVVGDIPVTVWDLK